MERFRFIALDAAGQVRQGVLPASSADAARSHLEAEELTLVRLDQARGFSLGDILNQDISLGPAINRAERAVFIDSLASLLDAGITLDAALNTLAGMQTRQSARAIVENLLELVRGGRSFSEALEAHSGLFPREMIAMVRAGEESGRLPAALTELSGYLSRANALRQKIIAALYYPAFLVVVALAAIIVIVTMVLPEFEPIFASAGQELPLLTRIVRGFGRVLVDYYWVAPLLGMALIGVLGYARRDAAMRRRRDRWLLAMPLFGRLTLIGQTAMLARVLGALLRGGVGIVRALDIVEGTLTNAILADKLGVIRDQVKRGAGFSRSLSAAGGFPPLFVQLAEVGEEAGRLDQMLVKVADIYDEQLRLALDRLVAILVPAITLVMGLVVAAITFAVLGATLGLNQLI
jgi:general secretion pathway protein F